MGSVLKTAAWLFALTLTDIAFAGAIPLTFSLIVSYGRYGYNSSPSIPAIELALEHINNSGVLLDYELQYTVKDSECNRGKSLDAFFDDFQLQSEPVKIALVGCGCSVATEPVAEISHRWNISQISFASAVSTLSDRTRFRNFFRTYPNSIENLVPALLSVLNRYDWNRIAFLTQNENIFNKLVSNFESLLENLKANTTDACCFSNTNITVVNRVFSTNEDPTPAIHDILEVDGDYRIFFVNSYSGMARTVICEAAKRNLTYPRFAWITYGWYPDNWWTKAVSKNNVSCSDQQLEKFVEKARLLQIRQYPTPDDVNAATIAGITPRYLDEIYANRSVQLGYTPGLVRGLSYDAIWVLALALNRTQDMFLSNFNVTEIGCGGLDGGLVPLEQFNYSNGVMGCVIRWNLQQTNFSGVSGHVRFDENGTVFQDRIRLLQYRRQSSGIDRLRFGYVDRTSEFVLTYEENESGHSVFPDGVPPDGTPRKIIHTFRLGLMAVYYLLAVAGIIFSVICLLFNFAFSKRKVVRMTSPKLNYLIVTGSLLMYCSVFIQLLYSTDRTTAHVQCILHTWVYVLGYLLAFGTILAKMWRVYQIFHNPTPNKAPKDWHLILIVLLITSAAIALVVGKTISQWNPPFLRRDNEESEGKMALGVREAYYVWVCYEPGSPAFYCDLLIFLYLALLQIVGIILAFQTRKVKIPALNDSKFVAALVYISSIVFVALVLITFLLGGYINISSGIFSGGIMLLATLFLILMFLPKMLNLYIDPHGEKIFSKSTPVTGMESVDKLKSTAQNSSTPEAEKTTPSLEEALRRISELEKELSFIKGLQNGVANNSQE